jgi:hypothetical protein
VVLAVDGPIANGDDSAGGDPEKVLPVTLGGNGGLGFVCGEILDIHENGEGGGGGGGDDAVFERGGDHGALRVVGRVLNIGGGNPDAVIGCGTAVLLLLGTVDPNGVDDDDDDTALYPPTLPSLAFGGDGGDQGEGPMVLVDHHDVVGSGAGEAGAGNGVEYGLLDAAAEAAVR